MAGNRIRNHHFPLCHCRSLLCISVSQFVNQLLRISYFQHRAHGNNLIICTPALFQCKFHITNPPYDSFKHRVTRRLIAQIIRAFESGSLELVLTDGQLRRLTIRCGGSVQVVLSRVDVVFQAEMEFTP